MCVGSAWQTPFGRLGLDRLSTVLYHNNLNLLILILAGPLLKLTKKRKENVLKTFHFPFFSWSLPKIGYKVEQNFCKDKIIFGLRVDAIENRRNEYNKPYLYLFLWNGSPKNKPIIYQFK